MTPLWLRRKTWIMHTFPTLRCPISQKSTCLSLRLHPCDIVKNFICYRMPCVFVSSEKQGHHHHEQQQHQRDKQSTAPSLQRAMLAAQSLYLATSPAPGRQRATWGAPFKHLASRH